MFGANYLTHLPRHKTEWWGVYDGETLVAIASLELRGSVAVFTSCAVLPAYRGLGLQSRLIQTRLRWLRRHTTVTRVTTYVHREKWRSLSHLVRHGFRFQRRALRGHWYHLYRTLR
jgi:GNAT superfamily N-acetyltransferase